MRTRERWLCKRRLGAFQGLSERAFTYDSLSEVLEYYRPQALSTLHSPDILPRIILYITDVLGLPEATSVVYVNRAAQGATHQFLCRGLVAQGFCDYSRGWLLPRLIAAKQGGGALKT